MTKGNRHGWLIHLLSWCEVVLSLCSTHLFNSRQRLKRLTLFRRLKGWLEEGLLGVLTLSLSPLGLLWFLLVLHDYVFLGILFQYSVLSRRHVWNLIRLFLQLKHLLTFLFLEHLWLSNGHFLSIQFEVLHLIVHLRLIHEFC